METRPNGNQALVNPIKQSNLTVELFSNQLNTATKRRLHSRKNLNNSLFKMAIHILFQRISNPGDFVKHVNDEINQSSKNLMT